MHPTLRIDNAADLADVKPINGVLERFLHLPSGKVAKVALLGVRGAVGFGSGFSENFRTTDESRSFSKWREERKVPPT